MKTSGTFAVLLAVCGFFLAPATAKAQGGPPIVGLWDLHYTSDFIGPWAETYQQIHSDGIEIETPDFAPGAVCMGTWKSLPTDPRTIRIFHVGFLGKSGGGPNGSVRFELRFVDTVNTDKNSFDGRYDQKYFDANGNIVMEDTGTVHGERLSVDLF